MPAGPALNSEQDDTKTYNTVLKNIIHFISLAKILQTHNKYEMRMYYVVSAILSLMPIFIKPPWLKGGDVRAFLQLPPPMGKR